MWTPKRIVMLAFGLVLFVAVYVVYATSSLGRINGLPPLPEGYYPDLGNGPLGIPDPQPPGPWSLEAKLIKAFGEGCPELNYAIRLDLHAKSMVLAAAQFQVLPDGRVSLTPFSVALFGKERGDGRGVEINTIQGRVAYLKFDRPISSMAPGEIGGRKITEAELNGDIVVINNRRTPQRDDDLWLNIPTGPLYYSESKHLVWTHDRIHLIDHQSKPAPHDIRGKGMEMELLTEAPPPKPGLPPVRKPPRGESITGVKRILLLEDVEMNLYIDGRSGFLGGQKEQPPGKQAAAAAPKGDKADRTRAQAKAPEKAPEKAHVTVKAPGRFTYEFFKDHDMARFDVLAGEQALRSHLPQDVTVVRHHPLGKTDQLVCTHLELRLRHKEAGAGPGPGPAPAPAPRAEASADRSLDVETAHATAEGKEVVLTSDPEKLIAHGSDFFYDAPKQLTILKGDPEMEADKAGSLVHAREMQIQDVKVPAQPGAPARTYQQVTALGPGRIDLVDSKTDKQTVHAFWNDTLTSTKDGEQDLLILTGSARFVDDEHDQRLDAEILKVWLAGGDKTKDGAPKEDTTQQARRPQHVEATGNVLANSSEMHVHDTARLVVWFKDVPADMLPAKVPGDKGQGAGAGKEPGKGTGKGKAPAAPAGPAAPATAPPAGPTAAAPAPEGPASAASPPSPAAGGTDHEVDKPAGPASGTAPGGPGTPAAPATANKPGSEPARPIDLSARSVEAWVLRSEVRNQVDRLWCEGQVHVRQDPAKPEEKGVDIQGDTLQMSYNPAGNFLVVTGDLGQLRMDKIYILGPEVNIDQATNKAWVYGAGAMMLESNTNFQGAKLDRTVPLTIHWNQDMLFNGEYAEYRGGIQAEQENARMACQRLQVFFDRPISLKEGNHSDQPARVRRLVCTEKVRVEDTTMERGRLVKFQRIVAPALTMDALEKDDDDPRGKGSEGNVVHVSGPGSVHVWQHGAADPLAPPPTTSAKPAPETKPKLAARQGANQEDNPEEEKVTYVAFGKRMDANSKTNTAYFWEDVRVLNMPSDKPSEEVDLDAVLAGELPKGAMFLRCDRLKVLDQPQDGRPNQQMEAYDRVSVQAREFYARADAVFYNQAKDQIIFVGKDGRNAVLSKVKLKGMKAEVLEGAKIIYSRTTGRADVYEGDRIIGN